MRFGFNQLGQESLGFFLLAGLYGRDTLLKKLGWSHKNRLD
jgi:hypothetical protein